MSTDIVHVKLINGDELIASLIFEDDECVILGSPMVIEQRVNTMSGSTVTVLVKYIQNNDTKEVTLNRSHVILVVPVTPTIEKYYTISKIYNEKYVQPNMIDEIEKVSAAMEDILYSPPTKGNEISKLKSTSNNTVH